MLIISLIRWWYLEGLLWKAKQIYASLRMTADFFSISLLLKTLFQPFRQIAANERGESLHDKFIAFLDRLFSRFIGCFVRLLIIVIGIATIIGHLLLGLVLLLVWIVAPLLPAVGVVLAVTGWVPWAK